MGWVQKIADPPPRHPCEKPDSEREHFKPGSIWECDECHTQWKFERVWHGTASAQNDRMDIWSEVPRRRPEPVFGNFQGRPADPYQAPWQGDMPYPQR